MNNNLIKAVLDCGVDDLNILDDAECNFNEIVEKIRAEGREVTLNSILDEVFHSGVEQLHDAVKALRKDLEKEEADGEMSEASYEQLNAMRVYEIEPRNDFDWFINFRDTHFSGDSDKRETYQWLFEDELQELVDYTSFDIEW